MSLTGTLRGALDRVPAQARGLWLLRLAGVTALVAFLLIVSGAVLRVTQSGLACEDWPLCYGQVFPVVTNAALGDILHRALTVGVGAGTVLLVALSWLWRSNPGARRIAMLSLALLAGQVLLGGALVRAQLEPLSRLTHLAVGMVVLACLAALPIALRTEALLTEITPAVKRLRRAFQSLAVLVFMVVVSGAIVSSYGAAMACGASWPLCNGGLLPNGGYLVFWQFAHRTLSVLVLLHAVSLVHRMTKPGVSLAPQTRSALTHVLLGLGVQALVGIALLLFERPAILSVLHSAVSALTWIAAIRLVLLGNRLPMSAPEPQIRTLSPLRQKIDDYVALTKPKVVSLLLFTTLATMYVTPRGVPPFYLVLWTALAGYLMVGAANAYNMWFDRDIDIKMGRTSLRPIPSGRIAPRSALIFSAVLLLLSLAIYLLFVNWLAALMALVGFIYYTVIYTSWLKRSTWQNIVIGGGAGAVPPLIGWAAATGSLEWAAMILFFIVFYWTPPHFWALAIMKQKDYANAGVPMLPVVSTETETVRQMLVYSFGMVAITLTLTPLGYMGNLYLVSAALLGAVFVWYAWKAMRDRTPKAIWGMYGFSLLYLALLFGVMIIDRVAV